MRYSLGKSLFLIHKSQILKNLLLVLPIVLFTSICHSQPRINEALKKELDQILLTDQIYREYLDNSLSDERRIEIASLTNYTSEFLRENIFNILQKNDSLNFIRIEEIITEYGYPGKSLVGIPTNKAAFYVIQHTPKKIAEYYSIIEEAGKNGELPLTLAAMMLDRKLAQDGKEQIYGTQVHGRTIVNKESGEKELFNYVVSIQDEKNVNQRRKEAGFTTTVEENVKKLGLEYKLYTYDKLETIFE